MIGQCLGGSAPSLPHSSRQAAPAVLQGLHVGEHGQQVVGVANLQHDVDGVAGSSEVAILEDEARVADGRWQAVDLEK